ncbi:hypothetical protein vseg_020472 [Gypsophila vaccaria]
MKLQSFALQSKSSSSSSSKPKPPKKLGENDTRIPAKNQEFVSEFDPSKTIKTSPKRTTVIPPKQNEWRPHKKMKNLELPPLHSANNPLDFEFVEDSKDLEGGPISYGLNVRHSDAIVDRTIDSLMIKQFKTDLETLPEEQGLDDYEDTPVDGFGAALLAGYGWKEGRGIGRNCIDDVKVVEYKRRTAKEGLGFMADAPAPSGSSNSSVVGGGKDNVGGRKDGFEVGREVRVVRGGRMGMKGVVVRVLEGGVLVLEDEAGGRESFEVGDVAELGSSEEEHCLKKLKELKIRESRDEKTVKRESGRRRIRSRDDVNDEVRAEKSGGRSSGKRDMWLMSHIRVRIISRELRGGRYYLKKGEVVDVIGPGVCDITMDEGGEVVRGVDQDVLETALPRRGGCVVVLIGKHKGVYGKLVEKDSEKETGVVQDADTLEMFNVRLEQIAEYLGDPSYLGY